jgi:hypothetical protein
MTKQPPELESVFDIVLEQIMRLIHDVEMHKWDAGVVIMVNNGQLDVRGLGDTTTTGAAFALMYMALKTIPAINQEQMMAELERIMTRSERIEKEADQWHGVSGFDARRKKYIDQLHQKYTMAAEAPKIVLS